MRNQITAVIVDDDTITFDGNTLVGMDAVSDALRSALKSDPHLILVLEPAATEHYKGIGTVIYASQRVGIPVENLRWATTDGDVVTFDQLKTRHL